MKIPELLAPIKERLENATPGPYKLLDNGGEIFVGNWGEGYDQKEIMVDLAGRGPNCQGNGYGTADLVANAPTDLDKLIRAVEVLAQHVENTKMDTYSGYKVLDEVEEILK